MKAAAGAELLDVRALRLLTSAFELEFGIGSAEQRLNGFYKIDMLIAAITAFRAGIAAEAALYRRREHELASQREAGVDAGPDSGRAAA